MHSPTDKTALIAVVYDPVQPDPHRASVTVNVHAKNIGSDRG